MAAVNTEDQRPLAHRVMASCHSLVHIPSSSGGPSDQPSEEMDIIGDPLETAVLEVRELGVGRLITRTSSRLNLQADECSHKRPVLLFSSMSY
jgi:hypothetical protein